MSRQASMLSNLKENQRVQIRRNQREEIFRQKRIIQFIEQTPINNENFREFIETKMTACINIYNHQLPQSMNELTDTIILIKQIKLQQEETIEAFIMAIFKKDFIKFLMIFLHEQYDQHAIQYQAALILANFFGMIKQKSPLYLSAYIPMLNYQGGNIVSCVGRLLLSKNDLLIEAALYVLGNLFCDQSCVVDEFRRQFGMNLILQLRTSDVIWILQLLFQNRVYFSTQELNDSIAFIDESILNPKDEYDVKQSLQALQYGTLYLKDLYNMIPRLKCFGVLFQRKQFTTLSQLARSSDINMLLKLAKNYEYIEFISERLSSRSKEEVLLSLKTLTLLVKKEEQFIEILLSYSYTLERIIALASQTDQSIILSALKLIKAMLSYRDTQITTLFLEKNLMPLLAQVLDYVHDKIIDQALQVLCSILDIKDDFSDEQDLSDKQRLKTRLEVGQLFCHHRIADKIFLAYQNIPDMNINLVEKILNEISYFENLVISS